MNTDSLSTILTQRGYSLAAEAVKGVMLPSYTNGGGKKFDAFRSIAADDQEAADILHRLVESGALKDTSFAESCINSWVTSVRSRNPRPMTHTMRYWLHRMVTPKSSPGSSEMLDLTRINTMFAKAKTKLKRPAVVLHVDGYDVKFSFAGPHSRYVGQVIVAAPVFGQGYYGRIDLSGSFYKTESANEGIVNLVRAFAANPEEVASQFGKLTGKCCFCNRPLCDDRSTAVGYGPVCAESFGLNWGRK
jgi:hypothetical protein